VRAGIDKRGMTLLASGHFATDFANGALPALLPYFKDRFGLSYTLAALLMLASAASSSVVQPLFGLWSDRHGALWLLPGGVATAGFGIALAADASSYWLVFLLVVVSGLGVAAFHPEGSKVAAFASGHRRASGMSAFSIGGNLGYAFGPAAAGVFIGWLGLRGGLLLALPAAAVGVALLLTYRFLGSFTADSPGARHATTGEDDPRALVLLLAVICVRSVAWFGLVTFVPLWEVSLGHSKTHGNHLLSLMLLAGGLGTILAGPAADRLGLRPVLLASLVATPPATAIFVVAGGAVGAAALAVVGASVVGTYGVTQVMSQQYLPRRIGMASGLSIGLSIGLGGVGAVLLGAIADSVDLRTAMWFAVVVPVVALVLGLFLPPARRRGFEPELVPGAP
jgi:FSR family fosmidomycin resistance protein-like MFS transporter